MDAWIVERRAAGVENRTIRRPRCEWPHQEGVVMPYDMEYSIGTFPVSFSGFWVSVVAMDIDDINDEITMSSVTKLRRRIA